MADNPFHNEIRQRFEQIIEKDKRRKRRTQYILFGIHLGIFILVVISTAQFSAYLNDQGLVTNNLAWFGLGAAGIITLIVHVYALFAAINTTVQDTVFESLMLLMAQNDLQQDSGKSKRQDETYSLSDDGELTTPQRQIKRNGSS